MKTEIKTKKRWLFKSFSIKNVKLERVISEIMILRNAGQNFDWKENDVPKMKFYQALEHAEDLANDFKFEESWGYILNAETLMVKYINTFDKENLNIRAKMILIESEKLNSSWRVRQIKTLLGSDVNHLNDITKDNLLKTMNIRSDYYITRIHKINLHKVNVNILALMMTLILAWIISLSFFWDITDSKLMEKENFPKGLVMCAIFGALGAGFSYGKTLFSYSPELNKIPDQLLKMSVTIFRFIIGASAGIVILLLLKSKFSIIIIESPLEYIVYSFVAGFSERWVVKMLGLVSRKKEKE